MTEEEMARYFEDRHAATAVPAREGQDDTLDDTIAQNGLVPTTKDPNLWVVKCRMGEEKTLAMLLMRKYFTYMNQDEPLQIKSVIVKEGLKGKLYIEAYKQAHVSKAIEGINAINQFQIQMVPIAEMVDTLKVVKNIPTMKAGAYVRLTKTLFKGDLARIDSVDVASNRVVLVLVPRIDYNKMRGGMRDKETESQNKSKRIPPPRLFDIDKIK
jgi:transcription elongation factor SPT5